MKLASLRNASQDGAFVVVSTDLSQAVSAAKVAPSLLAALETWSDAEPALEVLSEDLNAGTASDSFPLEGRTFESPLPRSFQFLDGSVYLYHAELLRQARGETLPPNFLVDPMMYQGLSDNFLGPCDDILAGDEAWGIDFEAEVGVVVDDVAMGVTPAEAAEHIKLVMLVNDVSLRNLIPGELAKGFGFVHGKPRSIFSPVAVSPSALGNAWDGAKLHGAVIVDHNETRFGQPDAGQDMYFDFPALIAHAAKTRPLSAGTIIGSGTVSNRNPAAGSCCLAERRTIETIADGAPKTPFMAFGDRVRIEMLDENGATIFGAIDQHVCQSPH
jgi:fumarylacetoacetate (FAA) hydrolase